jgi:chorismate dehydratase
MVDGKNNAYVFASVPYANAAPLATFLPQVGPGARVIYAPPSHLLACLLDGSADVAIVPVADFLTHPNLSRLADIGICADGDAWSVLLKCAKPLEDVRVVRADPASSTSNALARVLLEHHFRLSVRTAAGPDADSADAEVVIGDRALCQPPAPCGDYDLAGEWKAMTHLPFVFAVWACRADRPDQAGLTRIALAARDAGLAAVEQLARERAVQLGLAVSAVHEYLTSVIHYRVGPREAEAMERFRQYLQRLPGDVAPVSEGPAE